METKSIEQIKEEHRNTYQPLFDYMSREHNVTLLESDMSEIIHIVRTNNLPIDTLTAEIMVLRERVEELEEFIKSISEDYEKGLIEDVEHLAIRAESLINKSK